jgi:hypothetical protein
MGEWRSAAVSRVAALAAPDVAGKLGRGAKPNRGPARNGQSIWPSAQLRAIETAFAISHSGRLS